ncbi:dihydroorotate dehydrogenase [Planctomycetales bacterium]|nr:dihydroorotate dehydrogenase [Planctomycetales bacterium]
MSVIKSPFCHQAQNQPQNKNIRCGIGIVESNTEIADATRHLTIETETELPEIQAGQFVMLRLPNRTDPLLGRPLAVYRSDTHRLEVVYIVVGRMTKRLCEVKTGDSLEFWTPLGNGFPQTDTQQTILVAGGIGQTPFLKLAQKQNWERNQKRKNKSRLALLYGARSKNRIACMDDFRQLGIEPLIATDDGSEGHHGFVTDLIKTVYDSGETSQIFCCGPNPMLKSAFRVAGELKIPCFVSLETPMSCGLGNCFGCVVKYRDKPDGNDWDYRRTCTDGPVFDAYRLEL